MKHIVFTALVILTFCLLTIGVSAECTVHSFETADISVAPTCNSTGILTYTCSVCSATEERVIPAKHTYHAEVTVEQTCNSTGVLTYTCSVEGCGDSYTEEIPMHTFGEGVVTTPATCTTKGTMTYTCTVCTEGVKTEEIDYSHTYTEFKELYAPSCFFDGSIQFTCTTCGETVTEVIEKSHEYSTEIITEGSCTVEGVIKHTCMYCGSSHEDITEAKHTYDVINGDPTSIYYSDYTSTGVKYYTCANCSSSEGVIANPIFTFVGYSATEYDANVNYGLVEITCGFTVDAEALQLYQRVMGADKLQYGVVGAVESHLGQDVPPLVSGTGEPVDVTSQEGNFIVKKIPFTKNTYSTIDGKLINISYEYHTTYFYLALYIYDGTKTVYISDDSCREIPLPISYAMLVDGGEHDDVTTNSVSFGNGITYSTIEGTQPTQARLDLIASSAKDYKSQEATADTARDEDTVASIGNIGSWAGTVPNANALLNYYLELGGDATHYHNLDVSALISESTVAKTSWQTSINNILRAAELMAIPGETVNIDQTTETPVQLTSSNSLWNSNRDWYLTFIEGAYHTDTDLNNITVTEVNGVKTYSAQLVYTVIDYYSFYPYKDDDKNTSSFLLWGPTKKELAQLHLDGNALDFLIESSITYNVTWTEGQRPVKDADFGTIEGFENETYTSGNEILTVVTE